MGYRETATLYDFVNFLNELIEINPEAVGILLDMSVVTSDELPVRELSLLGILEGMYTGEIEIYYDPRTDRPSKVAIVRTPLY